MLIGFDAHPPDLGVAKQDDTLLRVGGWRVIAVESKTLLIVFSASFDVVPSPGRVEMSPRGGPGREADLQLAGVEAGDADDGFRDAQRQESAQPHREHDEEKRSSSAGPRGH